MCAVRLCRALRIATFYRMTFRDPVLLSLLASAAVTVWLLFERRARSRLHQLDIWAEQRGLHCERQVSLNTLAPLEPLASVPEVSAIDRGIQGNMQVHGVRAQVSLFACKVGNGRRPRPFMLAVMGAPQELPTLRVLPAGETQPLDAAPQHLGFVPMPASAVPAEWRTEAFQPLPRNITEAIGKVLRSDAPAGLRIELRPGRVVLALPLPPTGMPGFIDGGPDVVGPADRLLGLLAQLTLALVEALSLTEPGGGADPGADPAPAAPDPAPALPN
jgi:hypothetical protein